MATSVLAPHPLTLPDAGSSVPPPTTAFRADIEGLRGVAVLLVVAFHAGVVWVPGGFVGVDIFFVLSGYLITRMLVHELRATGRINFVAFYARRARRLLPVSSIVLVATLIGSLVLLSPLEGLAISQTGLWTATYASNIYFLRKFVDYFASTQEVSPYLHTWSLAVEEQFYLVWPVVLLLAWRAARSQLRVVFMLIGIMLVSFGLCVWLTQHFQPWAFFSMPTRAWEFGLGGLASLCCTQNPALIVRCAQPLAWLGLLTIVASGVALPSDISFPGVAAILPAIGTVVVLLGGAVSMKHGASRLLTNPLLLWFGRVSYAWYLWHWPLIVLAGAFFTPMPLAASLVAAAASLGLAHLTTRFVERPVRFHQRLIHSPGLTLGLAAVLTIGCAGVAMGAVLMSQYSLTSGPQQAILASGKDLPVTDQDGCMVAFLDVTPVECAFGDTTASTTIVLFGDSHASQWFPAVQAALTGDGLRIVTLLKSSCPPAELSVYNPRIGRVEVECDIWRADAIQRIKSMHPAAVILAGAAQGYVARPGAPVDRGYSTHSYTDWQLGERSTLANISSERIPALLLEDTPRPDFDMPTCLSRKASLPWNWYTSCMLRRDQAIDSAIEQADREAVEGLPWVELLDLSDHFCGPEECDPVVDGVYAYRDTNHMTASFASNLAPALRHHLELLVNH